MVGEHPVQPLRAPRGAKQNKPKKAKGKQAVCEVNIGSSDRTDQTEVERALSELRAGRAVVIQEGEGSALVAAAESIDANLAHDLNHAARGMGSLVLSAPRLRRLGVERGEAASVPLSDLTPAHIEYLALHSSAKIDGPVRAVSTLEAAALELARLALMLPAVVVVPADGQVPGTLSVRAEGVRRYRQACLAEIAIVSRAPVPLDGAVDSEFIVFRGGEGMREQVAIIVGKPDLNEPVTVRLHSACLTGDLFGSLKCDCGDQLRRTIQLMARDKGGILLYLDQEGRGNGIANKIRAYRLQAQGFDTYDADEMLGFEHDQRRFDFAASMLQALGVSQVRVMTNNPNKIAALSAAGLDVVGTERILGRGTAENLRYLASKRDRAGHFIDFDALGGYARATD
jgi:GTP cyclohydrolase II